ncbi:hypothetical protein GCM10010398_41540 [Streptomyces fimbriatus]
MEGEAEDVSPGTPSAACARSPHSIPSTNTAPTSNATSSARRPATVRITRRATPDNAADQVKRGWFLRGGGTGEDASRVA